MKLCKKKTNEKLTNCKLLLCIWILNKKTNLNSTNDFKFSNTHLNAGPIQQQICKNIDSLFVWMRLSLWFRVSLSLSLHSAGKQHVVGAPSLYLSLSLTSPLTNIKHVHAARALFIARSASLMIASLAIINIVNRYRHRHQAHQQC